MPDGNELTASAKAVGQVKITLTDTNTGEVIEVIERKNSVLNVGREAVLNGLANKNTADRFISAMVFGDGGAELSGSDMVERSVSRERDALFGVQRDETAVVCRVQHNNDGTPYMLVTGIIGSESTANGYTLNEVALRLNSGELYALMTWQGTAKTASVSMTMQWLVYFL